MSDILTRTASETGQGRVAYAHSKRDAPREEWHTLRDHLQATAGLASARASKWGAGDWGYCAGLWHDLGKFCNAFQRMIGADAKAERGRVNHSSAGALRAVEELGELGILLAFVIAGHHSGLPDLDRLRERLKEGGHLAAAKAGGADAEWLRPPAPLPLASDMALRPTSIELWMR
jgi:CRISPR-associated endonuclease/helicase Cas3